MIQHRVAKINVVTELMLAFYEGLEDALNGEKTQDTVRNVLNGLRRKVEKVVREKIQLFNTYRVGG